MPFDVLIVCFHIISILTCKTALIPSTANISCWNCFKRVAWRRTLDSNGFIKLSPCALRTFRNVRQQPRTVWHDLFSLRFVKPYLQSRRQMNQTCAETNLAELFIERVAAISASTQFPSKTVTVGFLLYRSNCSPFSALQNGPSRSLGADRSDFSWPRSSSSMWD